MPSAKNFGRQYVLGFTQEVAFDDFPNAQAGQSTTINVKLPPNAVLLSAVAAIETAFAGLTSPTMAIGDVSSGTRFLSATAISGAAGTVVDIPNVKGVKTSNPILFTLGGTGTATAGKVRVSGTYIMQDRVNEVME